MSGSDPDPLATISGRIIPAPLREVLQINPQFEKIFVDTLLSTLFTDCYLPYLDYDFRTCLGQHDLVFVAAPPKSGSTYLFNVIRELTQFNSMLIHADYRGNDNDIDLSNLMLARYSGACVARAHTRGTTRNAYLLKQFGVKLIVMTRNIFDTVVSFAKEMQRYRQHPNYSVDNVMEYSFLWPTDTLKHLAEPELFDAVIDLILPWYLNYYISWKKLEQVGLIKPMWINYEHMVQNRAATIEHILATFQLPVAEPERKQAVVDEFYRNNTYYEHDGHSMNPIGIGKRLLSAQQQAKIQTRLDYFSDIDFSEHGFVAAEIVTAEPS